MIDHNFDPWEYLQTLKLNQTRMNNDIQEITKGFNHRGQILEQVIVRRETEQFGLIQP